MKTQDEIKEFCLRNIAPYYKDPSTCGFDGNKCKYITSTGKMCVFGKNMKDPSSVVDSTSSARSILLKAESEESVLIPEAVGYLNIDQWNNLQRLHDAIAIHDKEGIIKRCMDLHIFTFAELKEYAERL